MPFRARIGEELDLPHSLHGVFITQRAVIGRKVAIYQNVTIGSDFMSRDPLKRGAPTLGDKVVVGAGAIIIGKVFIGSGARIGAGAVVTRDVPAGGVAYASRSLIHDELGKEQK